MRYWLIITCASVLRLAAQDLHFSQVMQNTSLLNPATTGVSSNVKALVNYRDQWGSVTVPYRTYGASFESQFNPDKWKEDEGKSMTFQERRLSGMAAGLSYYKDQAGDAALTTQLINLSLAGHVPVGRFSALSLGMQGTLVQKTMDPSRLIFSNQFDGTRYNSLMNSNEATGMVKYAYPDLATGFLWSFSREQRRHDGLAQLKAIAGMSVYHLLSTPSRVPLASASRTLKLHANLLFSLPDPDHALEPSFAMQWHANNSELIMGVGYRYYFRTNSKYTGIVKRNAIGTSIMLRNKDAVIFCFMTELRDQFMILYSYDLNVSRLTMGSSGRGGFEITLRYSPPSAYLFQKKEKAD